MPVPTEAGGIRVLLKLELQVLVGYPVWVPGIPQRAVPINAEPSLLSQQSISVLNVRCI